MDLDALPATDLAISMCSDGVWDNWKFEDVSSFVLDEARIAGVRTSSNCDDQVRQLMDSNLVKARANFGSSADNMTAVLLYMLRA